MKILAFLGALLGLATLTGQAAAQDTPPAVDPAYLSLGVGYYDIFDDADAADFRVEYTSGNAFFWKLKPFIGAEANSDGSVWAGGGIKADFKLAPNIYIDPSIGVGLYAHGGSDKDLDHVVEFRSQLEGGYEFTSGHRVGVAISHISNASLGDDNPGTEIIGVYYHIPVDNMF